MYMMARSSGEERRSETERLLSKLWFKAAASLKPYNDDLAFRCEVKGHSWADNAVWQSEKVRKLPISLNVMLDDLIDAELSANTVAVEQNSELIGSATGAVATSQLVDKILEETSLNVIEKAVRSKLDIPRGELTSQDFAAIEDLDLSGTSISTLTGIKGLKRLSSLNLSNCISLVDLSGLTNLKNLKVLNLRGCWRLTDLAPIAELKDLIGLNLEDCAAIDDIRPLSDLRLLQSIDLTGCAQISDLLPLARLDDLRFLALKDCWNVADLGPLDRLRNLKELYLQGCRALKDLSPLSFLTSLSEPPRVCRRLHS